MGDVIRERLYGRRYMGDVIWETLDGRQEKENKAKRRETEAGGHKPGDCKIYYYFFVFI